MEVFKTVDFVIAAYLVTMGKDITRLKSVSEKKIEFHFDDQCAELVGDYINGKALVEPNKFAANLKLIKEKIWNISLISK